MKKCLLTAVLVAAFATSGSAATYLLNESFDNDEFTTSGGVTTDLPDGWTRQDQYSGTNNDYRWGVYYYESSSSTFTGSYCLKCDAPMFSSDDGKGPRVERVFTPELDLQQNCLLSFQWAAAAKSSLEDKEYELQVRVLDVATNTETTIFNTSNEEDVRNSGVLADPNDASRIWPQWTKNTSTLDLSSFTGKKVKVVFVYNMMKEKANVL